MASGHGEPMDDKYRKFLNKVKLKLVTDMEVEKVLLHMAEAHVFTANDEEEITSKSTRQEKCKTFLDKLQRQGTKAYGSFIKALKVVQPFLSDVVIQAENQELNSELRTERQTSAGLRRKLYDLQTLVENEKIEREKLKEEVDRLKELLGEQTMINATNGAFPPGDEKLENTKTNSKVSPKDNEELNTSFHTELPDFNNNETIEPFLTNVQGSDELTKVGKSCSQCCEFKKQIDTLRETVKALQEKVSELELTEHTEEKELIEKTKLHATERIRRHANGISGFKSLYIENDFKKALGLEQEKKHEKLVRADVTEINKKCSSGEESLKKIKKKNLTLTLTQEKKKLTEENVSLKSKVKAIERQIKESADELNELKDVNTECNRLKQKTELDDTEIAQLRMKLSESTTRSEELEGEIVKSRTFDNCSILTCGNSPGVICTLTKTASNKVVATRSSDGPGEAYDVLSYRNNTTCGTEQRENSWWCIDLGENYILFLTHFALKYGRNDPTLRKWQLQGSRDGREWKVLRTEKTQLENRRFTITWLVEGKVAALRYFRILQTGVNSSGKFGIYFSGVELYGVLLELKH